MKHSRHSHGPGNRSSGRPAGTGKRFVRAQPTDQPPRRRMPGGRVAQPARTKRPYGVELVQGPQLLRFPGHGSRESRCRSREGLYRVPRRLGDAIRRIQDENSLDLLLRRPVGSVFTLTWAQTAWKSQTNPASALRPGRSDLVLHEEPNLHGVRDANGRAAQSAWFNKGAETYFVASASLPLASRIRDQIFVLSECRALLPPVSTVFGVSIGMVGLAELPGCPGAVRRVIRGAFRLPEVAASAARARIRPHGRSASEVLSG